jgi:hypothetical protein
MVKSLARHFLALSILPFGSLAAQSAPKAPRYVVQRDTIRYELRNPFRMYWARGRDTIGDPVNAVSVETHVWSGTADRPVVRVAYQSLGVSRFAKSNDYVLSPTGRILTIDGKPPGPGERGDLLIPLPAQALRVGVRWTDTTGTGPGKGADGEELDETIRAWEVARLFDTLGTHVADVRARGSWHMQLSYLADSATHRLAWLDVQGPMAEHDLFDVTHGRLLERSWHMDLRGRGVPPSGAPDTVAAGLRSAERMTISDSPRIRFLLRPLPGADTSVTVDTTRQSSILLHTSMRGANRMTSSLSRNDGMVGIAEIEFDGGAPVSYKATWAESGAGLIEQSLTRGAGGLVVHSSQRRDTTLALPNVAWAIADYGMSELLAPAVLSLPRDGVAHPLAVYRPYPGHWDQGTASVLARGGALIATLRFGTEAPALLAFTPEGDLLYGENSGPRGAKRFPSDAVRQARFRTLLSTLGSR